MPNYTDYTDLLRDLRDDDAPLDDILDSYRKGVLPHSEPTTLAIITLVVLANEGRMLRDGVAAKTIDESYKHVSNGYHSVFNLALGLAVKERRIYEFAVQQFGYTIDELDEALGALGNLHVSISSDPTGYSLVDFAHEFVTSRNSSPRYVDGANVAVLKYKRMYEAAFKGLNSPNGKQN